MQVKPFKWSIVIVGRWNRAILTPSGIAKRIFGIESGKQIEVAVPIDGLSPYMVKNPNDGITVFTDESRLVIELNTLDYVTLVKAMVAGVTALNSLPETPVEAVGININYQADAIEPPLDNVFKSIFDDTLSDAGFEIQRKTVERAVKFEFGQLNLTFSDLDGFKMLINFENRSTNSAELIRWLQTPYEKIKTCVDQLFEKFGLTKQEEPHGTDPNKV